MPAISPVSLVLTEVLSLASKVGFDELVAGSSLFDELGEGSVVEAGTGRLVLSPVGDKDELVALVISVEDASAVLGVTDGLLVLEGV